jgi:hypothetical protein
MLGAKGIIAHQSSALVWAHKSSLACTCELGMSMETFRETGPLAASHRRLRRHSSPCLIVSTSIGQTSMPSSGAEWPKPFTSLRGGPCIHFCVPTRDLGETCGSLPRGAMASWVSDRVASSNVAFCIRRRGPSIQCWKRRCLICVGFGLSILCLLSFVFATPDHPLKSRVSTITVLSLLHSFNTIIIE